MASKKVNKAKEPISKDKEEEMSSALIAQLLAEDAMAQGGGDNYYAEYSNDSRNYDPYQTRQEYDDSYEENSEDDFNPKKKASTKNAGNKIKN
jgi:protein MYSM1